MIRIDFTLGITLYLGFSIIILLIWIVSEWKKRGASSKVNKTRSLWQCPTCFFDYVDSSSESISKCPKCKTLHKRREKM